MKLFKGIALFSIFSLFLLSCGSKGDAEETIEVELNSEKDKLSYSFGAEQIKQLATDPNFKAMDKPMILKGFEEGLKSKDLQIDPACRETLQKLFGPYGQDFEVAYVKDGSECIGRMMAQEFRKFCIGIGAENKINFDMVKIGFQLGLKHQDTHIATEQRLKMINEFISGINQTAGAKMMEAAKAKAHTEVLKNGVIIETIQAGTGGSPTSIDDVEADYILTNAQGDTIESSIAIRKMNPSAPTPTFSLNGVIKGWSESFPHLKKGGKYRLYVPAELAYGNEKGSLCFYIDFKNFGKPGTLVKQQPMPQMH